MAACPFVDFTFRFFAGLAVELLDPAGELVRGELEYSTIVNKFGPLVAGSLRPVAKLAQWRTGRREFAGSMSH